MARNLVSAILATTALYALSGCGTCFNILGAEKAGVRHEQDFGNIYGGIRFELQAAPAAFTSLDPKYTVFENLVAACALAGDMPLCLIADTLTLPYTIRYTLQCQAEQAKSKDNGPHQDPPELCETAGERNQSAEPAKPVPLPAATNPN